MRKTTTAVLMGGLAAAAFAAPAAADGHEATVSVLHGVPGLTVDVYVNGEETLPDFEPGTLTDPLMLPAGSYDIEIYADGDSPDSAEPALSAEGLEVPGGANLTLAAHLGDVPSYVLPANPILAAPTVRDLMGAVDGQLFLGNEDLLVRSLAILATVVASINVFGGFAVTGRMLAMFRRGDA